MIIKDLDFINYERDKISPDIPNKKQTNAKKLEMYKVAQTLGNKELEECQKLIDNFLDALKDMAIVTFDIEALKFELNTIIIKNAESILFQNKNLIEAIGEKQYKEMRSQVYRQIIQKYNISPEQTDKSDK